MRKLSYQDLKFVIESALDELAELVRRNPGPDRPELESQVQAGLFQPGSASAEPTARDLALARELKRLEEDIAGLRGALETNLSEKRRTEKMKEFTPRKERLDRLIQAMGLNETAHLDIKINFLRSMRVPENLLHQIQGQAQSTAYRKSEPFTELQAISPALRSGGSVIGEDLAAHLRIPMKSDNWVKKGIAGGHQTQKLLEFVDNHPEYFLVEEAVREAAGTNFRRYSQYRWKGQGHKPVKGAASSKAVGEPEQTGPISLPTKGKIYDPNLWELSEPPKTTADDLEKMLQEAEIAWLRWRFIYTRLAQGSAREFGENGKPPAVSEKGIEFCGFFEYDQAKRSWLLLTIYISADWIGK